MQFVFEIVKTVDARLQARKIYIFKSSLLKNKARLNAYSLYKVKCCFCYPRYPHSIVQYIKFNLHFQTYCINIILTFILIFFIENFYILISILFHVLIKELIKRSYFPTLCRVTPFFIRLFKL